jgi:DNA-binding Lrp family transcriptional regulator
MNEYLKFCVSEKEQTVMKLYGSMSLNQIAKETGITRSTVQNIAKRVLERSTIQGFSPENDMDKVAPDNYYVKGTSTLYDENGIKKLQWVKTNIKLENLEKISKEMVQAFIDNIENKSPPTLISSPQSPQVDDLLTVYPMGDPHIGMYAWEDETNTEFNTEIAEAQLKGAVDYLVECAKPTVECLVVNLGDFLHADNSTNTTLRHGNVLDVDGRWTKILRIAINILIYIIEKALTKHENVTVINEIGNHDDHTSYVLSLVVEAYFRNNPRVKINLSPQNFHYYRFHNVLIGVTHGNNVKIDQLPLLMATDKSTDWGETSHRYWLVGHVHHINKKEYLGCVVESFRTLAGRDAWHSGQGYRAGRDMNAITYHKNYGEVSRNIINIDMITDF